MLVLSRKLGEKVVIGNGITVTVVEIDGKRIKLAFDAPSEVRILRGELAEWHDAPTPARDANPQRSAGADIRPHVVVNR